MFLINCLGFYASHPAAVCSLAGRICLCFSRLLLRSCSCVQSGRSRLSVFQQAASAFMLLSHPLVEQPLGTHIILGAEETRPIRNYSPEGEATHQQRTQIISTGCAKTGGSGDHTSGNQESLHRVDGFVP